MLKNVTLTTRPKNEVEEQVGEGYYTDHFIVIVDHY